MSYLKSYDWANKIIITKNIWLLKAICLLKPYNFGQIIYIR